MNDCPREDFGLFFSWLRISLLSQTLWFLVYCTFILKSESHDDVLAETYSKYQQLLEGIFIKKTVNLCLFNQKWLKCLCIFNNWCLNVRKKNQRIFLFALHAIVSEDGFGLLKIPREIVESIDENLSRNLLKKD